MRLALCNHEWKSLPGSSVNFYGKENGTSRNTNALIWNRSRGYANRFRGNFNRDVGESTTRFPRRRDRQRRCLRWANVMGIWEVTLTATPNSVVGRGTLLALAEGTFTPLTSSVKICPRAATEGVTRSYPAQ